MYTITYIVFLALVLYCRFKEGNWQKYGIHLSALRLDGEQNVFEEKLNVDLFVSLLTVADLNFNKD